jgi:hypothetical protein
VSLNSTQNGHAHITFNILVDRPNLDAQPDFWSEGWINNPVYIEDKLDFWANLVHNEVIMYGRPGVPPSFPVIPPEATACAHMAVLPGWAEDGANSVLWEGAPIARDVFLGPNSSVTIGGASLSVGQRVRITGALVLDCGHGATTPCHEGDNDPDDLETRNLEIHPVYSIDAIQDFNQPRPNADLTGVWAASDVGTYYVHQVGNTVWWLGLSRDQGRTFANVFRGTISTIPIPGGQETIIEGSWADVPLGIFQNNGNLSLRDEFCPDPANIHLPCSTGIIVNGGNVLETRSTNNGIFGGYRWEKLYDSTIPSVPVP